MTDCIENENDQKMEKERENRTKNDNFFIDGVWYKHSALETRNDEKRRRERERESEVIRVQIK